MYRGHWSRCQVREVAHRIKFLQKSERERVIRLNRIRSQERELALMKRIPTKEFAGFEKLRLNNNVRIIQRMWRTSKHSTKQSKKETKNRLLSQTPPKFNIIERISTDLQLIRESARPVLRADIAYKVDVDAVGLSELMERVRSAAASKNNDSRRLGDLNVPAAVNSGLEGKINNDDRRTAVPNGGGGMRQKYQDLFESRQKVSVLIDQYRDSYDSLKRTQVRYVNCYYYSVLLSLYLFFLSFVSLIAYILWVTRNLFCPT